MKNTPLNLASVILASCALLVGGPSWSAEPAAPTAVKKAAKSAKAKSAKAKSAKAKSIKKAVAAAAQPAVAATAASVVVVTAAPAVVEAATSAPAASTPAAPTAPAAAPANPYLNPVSAPSGNPYLVASFAPAPYVAPAAPVAAPANPYLVQTAPSGYTKSAASTFNIKDLLPSIPDGMSILPTIKKVYPTGEKPLVVLTFHCPTELIGITPIPTKLLHKGVDGLFSLVNTTNLLSFNLQQVCQ
jgi:hypothetical protein